MAKGIWACGLVISLPAAAFAFAGKSPLEVICSDIAASPSALVPPFPTVTKGALFTGFDRPFPSPDGSKWIMSCITNQPTASDELIIVGSGKSVSVVLHEGFAAPWAAGENVGVITERCAINNAGQFVFRNNTSATTQDEYIVKWDGAGFVVAAREGMPLNGISGAITGNTLDSPCIASTGAAAFLNLNIIGVPANSNAAGLFASTVRVRKGDVPGGQLGAPAPIETLSQTMFHVSDDGAHSIVKCSLPGTVNDDVCVVDGAVVAQEGAVLPNSGFAQPVSDGDTTAIHEPFMARTGDWLLRGYNAGTQDWVLRNGVVIARTDVSITPGNTEHFDDSIVAACFFVNIGNGVGDYVVGGATDHPDPLQDGVLVLNGSTVVARQGDAVDLNENGLPDDDAFILAFNDDQAFLTDSGWLYFTANLRAGSGPAEIGQAFVRVQVKTTTPCPADIAPAGGDGVVNVNDLLAVIGTWGGCAGACPPVCTGDINGDCAVNVNDLLAVVGSWGPCS